MKITVPERTTFLPQRSGSVALVPTQVGGQQALGRSMANIGREILERERRAKHQVQLQRVREQAEREQLEFLRRYDPTRYEDMPKELAEFQRARTDKMLESVSPEIRSQARGVIEGVWAVGIQKGDQLRYEYGLADVRSEHAEYRFEAMARASATDDLSEVTEIETEYYQTLDGLVSQGVYGMDRATELKLSFSEGVVIDRLREQMIEEPHVVAEMLDDPERFPRLSGEQRRSLLVAATNAARAKDAREEAERRRAEAEERRALANSQDRRFMQLYAKSVSGDLTQAEVDQARQARLLRPSQYTQLVRVLQTEDALDDPAVVRQLQYGILAGDIRNPMEVLGFIGDGLSGDTAAELVNMIEQGAAVVQSQDFKAARDYLQRQLGVTPGIQIGALQGDEQQRVARAMRELYERTIAGENPWTVADEMLPRYQRTARGLPKPMYPNEQALTDAYSRDEISDTVYEQQLELLDLRDDTNAP